MIILVDSFRVMASEHEGIARGRRAPRRYEAPPCARLTLIRFSTAW